MRAAITHAQGALDVVSARAPDGVDVVAFEGGADLSDVGFLVPSHTDGELLEQLPSLEQVEVVQVLSAGIDWIEDAPPPNATLCSARGARDAPVAEWVLAALLGASSRTLAFARSRRWDRQPLADLGDWTVLVVGMGSIGRAVEDRLEPFGAAVVGVASHARDDLHGVDELRDLLPHADAVVVLTPLTDRTQGLIGTGELGAMRDGALLVNAGRGAVVDTDALLAELESDRLRAVLDVTDPEPLPEDHPLWAAPGTLCITPHIAGDSAGGHRAAAELAADQLGRWARGEPLQNVVER